MEPHHFPTMPLIFIITIIVLCPLFVSAVDERHQNCTATFDCGNITNIGYPFWGSNRPDYCGHPKFWLNCTDQAALITIKNLTYQVLEVNSEAHNLKVARTDYIGSICPNLLLNTTLDFSFFSYASDIQNITLYYGCPQLPSFLNPLAGIPGLSTQFTCTLNNSDSGGFYLTRNLGNFSATILNNLGSCANRVIAPATQSSVSTLESSLTQDNLVVALEKGFGLQWDSNNSVCETCNLSGGSCGYNTNTSLFACYCADQPELYSCGVSAPNQPESSGASSQFFFSSKYHSLECLGIAIVINAF
ncbi:hypothetical protein GH714_043712 [Hevea brasiliensis]|uniref:non-specific serine/threonine protein kinase n=1 Tax=Hevea brasiliensis TaxID=3981 RepID=A0A6A6K2L8_HEVBR|nr:hypothetical protein GH714_043712 [Hevea brasiliensis]